MIVWNDHLEPLVFGSASAIRVPPGSEAGPLPYLFFSSIMDPGAARAFSQRVDYLRGAGRAEYLASRQALGASAETVYLVHTPQGDVALLVLDAPGALGVYDALGGASLPFQQWLERRALSVFALHSGKPGPAGYGERSEVVFRWHA
jgi:hypothetical protein